jgi:DNA recombination protein RmuC
MEIALIVLGVLLAASMGVCVWLVIRGGRSSRMIGELRAQRDAAGTELVASEREGAEHRQRAETLSLEAATLRERVDAQSRERMQYEAQLEKRLGEQGERFDQAMKATAAEVLQASNKSFLSLAEQQFEAKSKKVDELVRPISETLKRTDDKLKDIEKNRMESNSKLLEQVAQMSRASEALKGETGKLVKALRKPQVRGRYGEIQLERVAELAGMKKYCDFRTQAALRDDENRLQKPDMIVRLPNERMLAVDAKTNIDAYLDAIEAENPEEAEHHLDRFARHVSEESKKLASKQYWSQFDKSPDFVVMFIPGDQFVDAALQREPNLLKLAMEKGVLLASPTTLIAVLQAVAVGWREKSLADSANELLALGQQLHKSTADALGHAEKLGQSLNQATNRYNDFVGSVDRGLLPKIRRLEALQANSSKDVPDLQHLEGAVREFKNNAELPESETSN